jgi:hypothetical protein
MNVKDVMALSLGEWAVICGAWNKAHGDKSDVAPPSDDEFDAAVMAVRGLK